MKPDYVFPWQKDKSPRTKLELANIREGLYRRRYHIGRLETKPPDDVYKRLVETLDFLFDDDGKPWVLLLSNSSHLLSELTFWVPVTVSYSTLLVTANVTTAQMVDLFKAPYPKSVVDPDSAGETIDGVRRCGFLVWENACSQVPRAATYGSYFDSVLCKRLQMPTMFTSPYSPPLTEQKLKSLMDDIERMLGVSTLSNLKQYGRILDFAVDVSETPTMVRKK